MRHWLGQRMRSTVAVGVLALCGWVGQVTAQTLAAQQDAVYAPVRAPVLTGQRLSDWLLQHAGPQADTTALHWTVAAQRQAQEQLRQAVLQALVQGSERIALPTVQRQALAQWLQALPLTGRLPLRESDPRWLQAAPMQDPVLGEDHAVTLWPRPRGVVVLDETAQPCLVPHRPGALAADYLQACAQAADAPLAVDRVWVVQPNGRVKDVGVAPWNLGPQDEPAPGAWLWAPGRHAGLAWEVSDNLARFLATQPPGEFHPMLGQAARRVAAPPQPATGPPRGHAITSNDWGEPGYLQTPSARMVGAGSVRLHVNRTAPYTRATVLLQPLDGFEFGFRYTSVSNRLYGPSIAGDQAYKDKSIDVRLRLHQEDAHWPELTLGLRDVGGTGLFASEYLVASKRWGAWDASLGLAWGNLGSRGNVGNPLRLLGSSFAQRPTSSGGSEGGELGVDSWFKGPAALIGGVQWAPNERWVLKAELDGNSYQNEPQANNQDVRSPINLGLVYRYSPHIDVAVGLERGKRWSAGFTLHGNLGSLQSPKLLDVSLPPLALVPPAQAPASGPADLAGRIALHTGWTLQAVTPQHHRLQLVLALDEAVYLQARIDRVITLLHAWYPSHYTHFTLALQQRGLSLTQVEVDRAEWVAQRVAATPPALRLAPQQAYALDTPSVALDDAWQAPRQGWDWQWGPSYSQVLGGPDGFLIFQLGVQAQAEYTLAPGSWVSGGVNLRLVDNYERFDFDPPSGLPRVRRDFRRYVTASRLTVPHLQFNHARHLGGAHYGSVYAGYLETMFGGVGAEWLYRPWRSRWALGVDVNRVRQRAFAQDFSFRDYTVNTGHASLYWDTGWNDVQVKLQAGRYLAGDVGATLDVKRTFRNGVSVGAWATKTNASSTEFGEGSFDKGIYVNIPFDAMLPISSPLSANISWVTLVGDGGARLNRRHGLFDLTAARSPRALWTRSAESVPPSAADDTSQVLAERPLHPLRHPVRTGLRLADQVAGIPRSTWMWAGGAVLASALLDTRADRWAQDHQNGRWDQLGRVANATPYVLAAGAGALAFGLGGEPVATTAETSLRAAVYAVGTSLAMKTVLGRERPSAGLGAASFSGPGRARDRGSFPSVHTTAAFALVTPFAQQYRMPWLYAVAGAAGVGRVQQREHWVSDTVAGAFIGYGVGSLLSGQQQGSPLWQITPDSISAHWSF